MKILLRYILYSDTNIIMIHIDTQNSVSTQHDILEVYTCSIPCLHCPKKTWLASKHFWHWEYLEIKLDVKSEGKELRTVYVIFCPVFEWFLKITQEIEM